MGWYAHIYNETRQELSAKEYKYANASLALVLKDQPSWNKDDVIVGCGGGTGCPYSVINGQCKIVNISDTDGCSYEYRLLNSEHDILTFWDDLKRIRDPAISIYSGTVSVEAAELADDINEAEAENYFIISCPGGVNYRIAKNDTDAQMRFVASMSQCCNIVLLC